MSRLFQIPLALRLILPFTVYGFSKTPPPQNELPDLRITIRVFNYAKVSPQTWAFAQTVAARIFRQAGIETLWLDCSLSSEGTYSLPVCDQPQERTTLILRIVPASPATRINFGDGTLGIAAQSEKGTPASAIVFYDRVEELAQGGGASAGSGPGSCGSSRNRPPIAGIELSFTDGTDAGQVEPARLATRQRWRSALLAT